MNNEQSNTPTQQGITPDIKPMLDEAFNDGVDQCIGLIEGLFAFGTPNKASIIDLLNKLKKQPS